MKYFYLFLILIFSMGANSIYGVNDALIYNQMKKAMRPIEKKYNMRICGIGQTFKFTHLDLCLERRGDKLTKEEARKLIISCVNEFIENINKDLKIANYLPNFPITIKNVSMVVINYDLKNNLTYHPYIGGIIFSLGYIEYNTNDPTCIYKLISREFEEYPDAIAALGTSF